MRHPSPYTPISALMMSSTHALQSSTTSDQKLLKSVEALRPSLYESLRYCSSDPYMYFNMDDIVHNSDLLQPHYSDDLIENQINSCNLGSEEQYGMIAEDVQASRYDPIGCGLNAIVYDEENGLSGYLHDDSLIDDLVLDQCPGYEHEGNTSNSSVNMPELSTNIGPGILCSLESSMHPHGMYSFTSTGFSSQDDCSFPIKEPLQPSTLYPHSVYTYNPHLHSQQDFRDYPQCPDVNIDEIAASMYNADLYPRTEGSCNDIAINHFRVPSTPIFLPAEAPVRKSASSSPSQWRKKQKSKPLPDVNVKHNNSFDATDALQENGDNCCDPNAARASGFSSNVVCERRRRKKINEALYALRSVVPHVSKMDKASIMSDALTYAKQLQKRVDDLQNDIRNLHADNISKDGKVQEDSSGDTNNPNKSMLEFEEYFQSLPKHKISELSVFKMENDTYHLRICCEKGLGAQVQLTRVIEALNFDALNSSVAVVGEQSTINTIIKVDMGDVLNPKELRARMLDIVDKCGLHL